MNSKSFIFGSSLLSLIPTLLFGASFAGLFSVGVAAVVSMVVGVVFSVHAFRETSLTTEDKVLWSIAMVLMSPALAAPVYWFSQVRPLAEWHEYAKI